MHADRQLNVALASNGGVASASSTMAPAQRPGNVINNQRSGAGCWAAAAGGTMQRGRFPDWIRSTSTAEDDRPRGRLLGAGQLPEPGRADRHDDVHAVRLDGFSVQGWNGTEWVTLGSVTGNKLVKRTVTFSPYTTDRIRIHVTKSPTTVVADHRSRGVVDEHGRDNGQYALAVQRRRGVASRSMAPESVPGTVIDNQRSGAGL